MEAWKIWCQTTEELDKVLAKMESEGIKWGSGQKPTELAHGSVLSDVVYCAPIGLTVYEDKELCFVTANNVTDFMNSPYLQQYKTRTVSEYMAIPKPFTKADLQTGHIVTLRNGTEAVVIKGITSVYQPTRYHKDSAILREDIIINENTNSWEPLLYYTDDLKMPDSPERDIVKVELMFHPYNIQNLLRDKGERKLVWERKPILFKASALHTGHVVTLKNGGKYGVFRDVDCKYNNRMSAGVLIKDDNDLFIHLDEYDEETLNHKDLESFQIVKIEHTTHPLQMVGYNGSHLPKMETIWEREE